MRRRSFRSERISAEDCTIVNEMPRDFAIGSKSILISSKRFVDGRRRFRLHRAGSSRDISRSAFRISSTPSSEASMLRARRPSSAGGERSRSS